MAPMAEYLTGRFARARGSGAVSVRRGKVSAAVRRPVRLEGALRGAGCGVLARVIRFFYGTNVCLVYRFKDTGGSRDRHETDTRTSANQPQNQPHPQTHAPH